MSRPGFRQTLCGSCRRALLCTTLLFASCWLSLNPDPAFSAERAAKLSLAQLQQQILEEEIAQLQTGIANAGELQQRFNTIAKNYTAQANQVRTWAKEAADKKARDDWLKVAAKYDRSSLENKGRASTYEARLGELQLRLAEARTELAAKKAEQRAVAEAQPAPPARTVPTIPFKLDLLDVPGVWRETGEGDWPLVILRPEPEVYKYKLEAHTSKRIWKGWYEPLERGDPSREHQARLQFTYKPKAAEMNKDIPDWARKKVAGQLEWEIEIDEAGSVADPRFKMRWYPGEVEWSEEEGNATSQVARVVGKGKPRDFQLGKEAGLRLEPYSRPSIRVVMPAMLQPPKPGQQQDGINPSAPPIENLVKHQPFSIKVTLPVEQAEEVGQELTVTVRAMKSGGSTQIKLTSPGIVGIRPATYSMYRMASIADRGSETARDPSFGSLAHIFSLEGTRLDLTVESGEQVEFSYEEATHRVTVYNSWVQRDLVRHKDAFFRLQAYYAEITGNPRRTQAQKQAAHTKQRMLSNYWALRQSGKLTDLHKYYLGELYLGTQGFSFRDISTTEPGIRNRSLVDLSSQKINELSALVVTIPPSRNTQYFNGLVQAFLEGLTGKNLDSRATAGADGIIFTSAAERDLARWVILDTSENLGNRAIKTAAKQGTLGLYNGFVTATGASDVYIVLTGRDHNNKWVPQWERVNTAVLMGLSSFVAVANSRLFRAFLKSGDAVTTMGKAFPSQATLRSSPSGKLTYVDNLDMPQDLPSSVGRRQLDALYLPMEGNPRTRGGPDFPKPRPGALEGIDLGALNFVEEANDLRSVTKDYGPEARILDMADPPVFDRQVGQTCNLMSIAYLVQKRLGRYVSEAEALEIVSDLARARIRREARVGLRGVDTVKAYDAVSNADLAEALSDVGVSNGVVRDFARSFGARVAEVGSSNPKYDLAGLNQRVNLRHVRTALGSGYDVKIVLKLDGGYHAVIIDELMQDADGVISHVRFYDPSIGRIVETSAGRFDGLIARRSPDLEYGILTVFKWDNKKFAAARGVRVSQSAFPRPRSPLNPGGANVPRGRFNWKTQDVRNDSALWRTPWDRNGTHPMSRSLDEALFSAHPLERGGVPPNHETSLAAVLKMINGTKSLDLLGDASFSIGKTTGTMRQGGIAIRVKPDSASKHVVWSNEVTDARPNPYGLHPLFFDKGVELVDGKRVGIGKNRGGILLEHLEWFDPRGGRWLPLDGQEIRSLMARVVERSGG